MEFNVGLLFDIGFVLYTNVKLPLLAEDCDGPEYYPDAGLRVGL